MGYHIDPTPFDHRIIFVMEQIGQFNSNLAVSTKVYLEYKTSEKTLEI